MGSFSQLGDCVCPACVCQHHAHAFNFLDFAFLYSTTDMYYTAFDSGAVVIQESITLTERCGVVVMMGVLGRTISVLDNVRLERPLGTIVGIQRNALENGNIAFYHFATWEVLDPGVHTYYFVNRHGSSRDIAIAWIKIVAFDCEG